jgi:putative ABC transport system substrate-binding protein
MELVALAPDLILAHGGTAVAAVLEATRTIPIVFPVVGDPVGAGFVESIARPGGNATGFMTAEYSMGGKWLELLKEFEPSVTRVGVLRDPAVMTSASQFAAIQASAISLNVAVRPINIRDAHEIERSVAAIAGSLTTGLIVTAGGPAIVHRELIVTLAARHKLLAVYFERLFTTTGGLVSYGPDYTEQYRHAASYVDRILKGENPAELPVQAPPSTSWSSISGPPKRSASKCRRRCWPGQMRSLSETPRVHHAAQRRGDIAACGACAAAGRIAKANRICSRGLFV